jgi:hypothetical protein
MPASSGSAIFLESAERVREDDSERAGADPSAGSGRRLLRELVMRIAFSCKSIEFEDESRTGRLYDPKLIDSRRTKKLQPFRNNSRRMGKMG